MSWLAHILAWIAQATPFGRLIAQAFKLARACRCTLVGEDGSRREASDEDLRWCHAGLTTLAILIDLLVLVRGREIAGVRAMRPHYRRGAPSRGVPDRAALEKRLAELTLRLAQLERHARRAARRIEAARLHLGGLGFALSRLGLQIAARMRAAGAARAAPVAGPAFAPRAIELSG